MKHFHPKTCPKPQQSSPRGVFFLPRSAEFTAHSQGTNSGASALRDAALSLGPLAYTGNKGKQNETKTINCTYSMDLHGIFADCLRLNGFKTFCAGSTKKNRQNISKLFLKLFYFKEIFFYCLKIFFVFFDFFQNILSFFGKI